MRTLNKVFLIGRLGKDPELKYTTAGKPVLSMSIATDESYVKDGQRVERAEWHTVVCYEQTAENCARYLNKGSLIHVEGSLFTRKWQDKDNNDRYSTEIRSRNIIFLDSAKGGSSGDDDSNYGSGEVPF